MRSMRAAGGSFAGFSTRDHLAVGLVDVVDDARRGRDEVEVELALEALLDDLHVEQPEEAAAEAEAERLARVGLEGERGVVQVQLLHRVAELRVVGAVGRVDPGEDHRLHVFEAGQRLGRGPWWCGPLPGALTACVTVSPSFTSWTLLMFAGEEADLARYRARRAPRRNGWKRPSSVTS